MIQLVQIGAGGTGSWFARTFMHNVCELIKNQGLQVNLTWTIIDPDIIENRNIIRQPFYGGVGRNKAEFLVDLIRSFFSFHNIDFGAPMTRGVYPRPELATLDLLGDDINIISAYVIISCVDNTYTRKIAQEFVASNRSTVDRNTGNAYLDMGVAPDGDWSASLAGAGVFMPLEYDKITYPDAMMSCAVRNETGPVPQSVFSNIMAGANAAQMLTDYLLSETKEQFYKGLYGFNTGEVSVVPIEDYYKERLRS